MGIDIIGLAGTTSHLEDAGQSLGKIFPEFQTPHLEIKNLFQSVGSEILEKSK